MAWFQVDFHSACLKRPTQLNIFLPADGMFGAPAEEKLYPTLYLLHGYMNNNTEWMFGIDIQSLAQRYGICIVMPSGDNSFYVDYPGGPAYGELVGREIVEFTRRLLPLSPKREDTIIGGLSMGGYGALRNGIKYADTFGHTIALSPAIILERAPNSTNETNAIGSSRAWFESVFGDVNTIFESDANPEKLARDAIENGKATTDLYLTCGWNDMLVERNRKMATALKAIGYPFLYEEGEGSHVMSFWEPRLIRALDRIFQPPAPPAFMPFWREGGPGEFEI